MIPPRTEPTRERFLRAAAQLFQRKGYASTGINEITLRGGAPKGSFYFHFPGGKAQLCAEALRFAGKSFQTALSAVVDTAPNAPSAIRALADALGGGLEASDYSLGCPLATTVLEASDVPEIRAAAEATFTTWTEILAERLKAEGAGSVDAREKSIMILSAFEGALILARAVRSTEPLQIVGAQLADQMNLGVRRRKRR